MRYPEDGAPERPMAHRRMLSPQFALEGRNVTNAGDVASPHCCRWRSNADGCDRPLWIKEPSRR